jgi:hypothetical protein
MKIRDLRRAQNEAGGIIDDRRNRKSDEQSGGNPHSENN